MRGYRFNLRQFVADLGGPVACWRRLKEMGIEVRPATVNKWVERDDMALVYLINLMAHEALAEGPMDLNPYILPMKGCPPIRPRASCAPAPATEPAPPRRTALQG
jgi:hypothetical protein